MPREFATSVNVGFGPACDERNILHTIKTGTDWPLMAITHRSRNAPGHYGLYRYSYRKRYTNRLLGQEVEQVRDMPALCEDWAEIAID